MAYVILVVDDSPIQRKLTAAVLKASGYDVLVAEDGAQGIEIALQSHPDLILMDIAMPGMDGSTAVRHLRQHPGAGQVPVLAITAMTAPEDLDEAYQAGYDDIIDKNSDRAVLLDKIHLWLTRGS